jgi:hypothetical protein
MSFTDVPDFYVFDGDPDNNVQPRRPTVDDLGGAEFEDDPVAIPVPPYELGAAAENQQERVLAGLAQTAFMLVVSVEFSAGAPVLAGFSTTSTRLTTESFTLTDNAAGDTLIEWPAGTLPPRTVGPVLSLNEDEEIDRTRAFMAGDGNGVRVITKLGATGTDCAFTVCIP